MKGTWAITVIQHGSQYQKHPTWVPRPGCLTLIQLLANIPGKAMEDGSRRPKSCFWLLLSEQPNCGFCSHLECELVHGISLSSCPFLILFYK